MDSPKALGGQDMLRGIHRFTSVLRTLDPGCPTNRAVWLLMPAGALIAGIQAFLQGDASLEILKTALFGLIVVLGGWAFTRELVPDDDWIAFVSLLLAFGAFLAIEIESHGILLLFVAIFLVRTVNRTVGLPSRPTDSIVVVLLTSWVTYSSPFPWLALVGFLAFALDASLKEGLRRQWIFAGVCLMVAGLSLHREGLYSLQDSMLPAVLGLSVMIGAGYGLAAWRTRAVKSLADATRTPLSLNRVRAGMVVGFLVGLQSLTRGQCGIETAALVWASLAGVSLGGLGSLRRFLRTSNA